MAQKATVVMFHEVNDEAQVIVIRGFSVQDYATMAREINNPVCSLDVLNWIWREHAYIVEDKIKWISKAKTNISVFDVQHIEFCIKLEEIQ
jgi:hypothetical protein